MNFIIRMKMLFRKKMIGESRKKKLNPLYYHMRKRSVFSLMYIFDIIIYFFRKKKYSFILSYEKYAIIQDELNV